MRYLHKLWYSLLLAALTLPLYTASAHEVYVLTQDEIEYGIATPSFAWWQVILNDLAHFIFWAFIGALLVFVVFFVSISRKLEQLLDPFLSRLRRYAPVVSRVTIGVSFLAAAYYQAAFGPELPFSATFGNLSMLVTLLLLAIGLLIIIGFYARLAALTALALFGLYAYQYGWYMLTYTNYLGEILILLILGSHRVGIHAHADTHGRGLWGWWGTLVERLTPYSFVLLRVAFGISLLYASIYAKFYHNVLALQVASVPLAGHAHTLAYNLGGFEPHFLVLGAGIVEIVIGLFFLLGIEIRFTALFLEFWLALSLIYFGEVVWPHLILIGIPIAFIFYGYDKYSLEGYFFKDGEREPVL